jgi:hypothetical protein
VVENGPVHVQTNVVEVSFGGKRRVGRGRLGRRQGCKDRPGEESYVERDFFHGFVRELGEGRYENCAIREGKVPEEGLAPDASFVWIRSNWKPFNVLYK